MRPVELRGRDHVSIMLRASRCECIGMCDGFVSGDTKHHAGAACLALVRRLRALIFEKTRSIFPRPSGMRLLDVIHAFALTWDLRDETNLPLLFIDGDANDGFLFRVCTSAAGVATTGSQIIAALSRGSWQSISDRDRLAYVQDNHPCKRATSYPTRSSKVMNRAM